MVGVVDGGGCGGVGGGGGGGSGGTDIKTFKLFIHTCFQVDMFYTQNSVNYGETNTATKQRNL